MGAVPTPEAARAVAEAARALSFGGSVVERFWANVERRGPEECWPWTASTNQYGYGRLQGAARGAKVAAHRLSYEIHKGAAGDLCVLHHCDNPRCVNPRHLFLGTHADNCEDKVAKGRQPRGEGLPFSRLTEADVRAIRASNEKGRDLAKRYGVAPATITRVRRGHLWRHVR